MTTRKAVAVNNVEAAEVEFAETVKGQTSVMVQRLAQHRDAFDIAIKALEGERFHLQTRLDLARRQFEAIEAGIQLHLSDVENSLKLYENGLNSIGGSVD